MTGKHQRALDNAAADAAVKVTRALHEQIYGGTFSDVTVAIRDLIKAEIAAATPGILRQAGVVIKDTP